MAATRAVSTRATIPAWFASGSSGQASNTAHGSGRRCLIPCAKIERIPDGTIDGRVVLHFSYVEVSRLGIDMMSSKRTKKSIPPSKRRSAVESLLERKCRALLAAEKRYWRTINSLYSEHADLSRALELPAAVLPSSISSTVWALKDGAAFVRYQTVGDKPSVNFRVLPRTIEEWTTTGLIVPVETGEISLARSFGRVGGRLYNCSVDGVNIPFVEFSHIIYGHE
jgi:hypothetical protein